MLGRDISVKGPFFVPAAGVTSGNKELTFCSLYTSSTAVQHPQVCAFSL